MDEGLGVSCVGALGAELRDLGAEAWVPRDVDVGRDWGACHWDRCLKVGIMGLLVGCVVMKLSADWELCVRYRPFAADDPSEGPPGGTIFRQSYLDLP